MKYCLNLLHRLFFYVTIAMGCVAVLCHSRPAAATDIDLEDIKQYDKEVFEQKKKIDRVKKGIRSHESKVAQSKSKEIDLLAELEKLNEKILAESRKLSDLQEEMDKQDELFLEKKQEMEKISQEKKKLGEHMKKRLAAYYRMGDIGIMNVIFSASSLPELLTFQEYFHLMLKYDYQVIASYKDKMIELEAARLAHEAEKIKLKQAADQVMEQQKSLAAVKLERRKLLERTKTEKKLYQQAIREMEKAADDLKKTLANLEEKATTAKEERELQRIRDYPLKAFKKRKPAAARGFASLKGKLPLPTTGSILQKFGEKTDATFGVTSFTNGIDIESAPGADVVAVFEGKVVYAGALRGYGQLVIIDHGNHYFTLMSGVGEILKKVGDFVEENEKIAVSSRHTGLLQEGLHFEIRHNTEALDPLEWLDPSFLSFKNVGEQIQE
ncbi:MAG: peptidoglycan DD-metalloendopeptidase family protein [Desulfobulbaceae bacterium]|nr:peptidoglycan DD-metalloendopeptidase family protein [Desulfobulbaceae bacterium]